MPGMVGLIDRLKLIAILDIQSSEIQHWHTEIRYLPTK